MGECFSNIAKHVVSATLFVSVNNKEQKDIFTFLCFVMISSIQNKETKYSFHIKSPHPQPIVYWCIKLYLYKRYLKFQTKIRERIIILQGISCN